MHHRRTNVTHEGRVPSAPGSLITITEPHHDCMTMKTTFESIQITLFFFRKTVDVSGGGRGDKTRQDVEQGSILPARADKLLGLHGPNN